MAATFLGFARTYIADAKTANYSVARPPGVAEVGAGVVLLAFCRRNRGDNVLPAAATMPGWTLADGDATNFFERLDVFYKTSTAAEPSSYTITGGSAGGTQEAIITAWSNCYPIGSGSTFVGQHASTGTTMQSLTFTPPAADSVSVNLFMSHAADVVPIASTARVYYGLKRFVVSSQVFATTAAGQHSDAAVAVGNSANWVSTFLLKPNNRAPYKPTLSQPPSGAARDMAAAGSVVSWQHNDPDGPQDTQSAYRLRRTLGVTNSWWDGSAWQSTEQNVVSTAQSVTFAASKWVNGNSYSWAVATRDQSSSWGPYSDSAIVEAASAPVVTVDAPAPLVTNTTRPAIEWTYTQGEADPQVAWEAKVTTADDPSTAVWSTSGSDDAAITEVTVDLDNGTTYRAYVRAARENDLWSPWAYAEFLLDLEAPAVPDLEVTVDADPNTGVPMVRIVEVGHDNLLSAVDASYVVDADAGTAESVANAGTPASTDEVTPVVGLNTLKVTPTVSGQDTEIRIGPVDISEYTRLLTGRVASLHGGAASQFQVGIEFVDEAGVSTVIYGATFQEDEAGSPPPPPPEPDYTDYTIYWSANRDRTQSAPLSGSTVTTDPVIFLAPLAGDPDVKKVEWYIDGVLQNSPPTVAVGSTVASGSNIDFYGDTGVIRPGDTVTLPISATDLDYGETFTYLTTQVTVLSTAAVSVSGSATAAPSFVPPVRGDYVFWVDVTDSHSGFYRATVVVHVTG